MLIKLTMFLVIPIIFIVVVFVAVPEPFGILTISVAGLIYNVLILRQRHPDRAPFFRKMLWMSLALFILLLLYSLALFGPLS